MRPKSACGAMPLLGSLQRLFEYTAHSQTLPSSSHSWPFNTAGLGCGLPSCLRLRRFGPRRLAACQPCSRPRCDDMRADRIVPVRQLFAGNEQRLRSTTPRARSCRRWRSRRKLLRRRSQNWLRFPAQVAEPMENEPF